MSCLENASRSHLPAYGRCVPGDERRINYGGLAKLGNYSTISCMDRIHCRMTFYFAAVIALPMLMLMLPAGVCADEILPGSHRDADRE